MQRVEHSFFLGKAWCPACNLAVGESNGCIRFHLRRFAIDSKACNKVLEEFRRNVSHSVKSGWLKLFEPSVIEDFADAALQSGTTDIRSHDRPILRCDYWLNICLMERLWFVSLELVLVQLRGSAAPLLRNSAKDLPVTESASV
jgi:hypothetical protein